MLLCQNADSAEILDAFVLIGARYDGDRVRVGVSEKEESFYSLAKGLGTERSLDETNHRVVGREFYLDEDLDDYSNEDDFDWKKESVSIVSFEPYTKILFRHADWWANESVPDSANLTPTVAKLLYYGCSHEMKSGCLELETRNVDGVVSLFDDAGFTIEGFDGKWRLDSDEAADFRLYAGVE